MVEHADQSVDAGPNADRGAGGDAAIVAGQSAMANVRRRCDHRPDQHARVLIADVDAELGDVANVMFLAAIAGKDASHLVGGPEDLNPQPLLSWHERVPTLTVSARAWLVSARAQQSEAKIRNRFMVHCL